MIRSREAYDRQIPEDDIYLFNTGKARKAWLAFGCVHLPAIGVHRFLLWAPHARSVSLVGDFNGWDASVCPMEWHRGGVWVAFLPGLRDGNLYKYAVTGADGEVRLKSDPFAAKAEQGIQHASVICCDESYDWNDGAWMQARASRDFLRQPMNIYELHAGSWMKFNRKTPAYRQLADRLASYCHRMGYTHVELLPLAEYPYDGSWGYQVTGYYAVTSRYGSRSDFQYFVDRMHARGIGVILDWVPAHFPRDAFGLAEFDGTPLFECKERRMAEHPEWGTLIFDYASPQVRSFLISAACRWFEDFHADGIRVDAVSSMLYLDYCRKPGEFTPNAGGGNINLGAVEFLRTLNTAVLTTYPGAITVAEESTDYPRVTAPPHDGGLGFCFKWDMGFMHDTLDYMQLDPLFRSSHHNKLTFSMMYAFRENYVLAYSHDEVVHGKKSMLDKMHGEYDQKFASLRALYGFQFAHPGKKLTFMGSEFGQFIEWNPDRDIDWLLLRYPRHREMQRYCRCLNRMYTSRRALYDEDGSWAGFHWLNVDDFSQSSIAFLRTSRDGRDFLVCACNFTPVQVDGFVIGLPERGTLKELLNSDETRFGGTGVRNEGTIYTRHESFLDLPHSARITLPPMAAVWFRYRLRQAALPEENRYGEKPHKVDLQEDNAMKETCTDLKGETR